mgnify:CR=1 FL=1
MNYTFKEINSKELDDFSFNSPKGHIFQSSNWAIFKNEWENKSILGFDENNNIILSCVILMRKIPMINSKIGYIPRGFVCNYENEKLVESFTEFLKQFSKQNKISFITIDPDIHLSENNNQLENGLKISSMLESLGYIKNSSKNFENIQPNFVFRLNLKNIYENNSKEELKLNILKHFSSKARYNIKLGIERGLTVENYTFDTLPEEKLKIFQELMDITGKRDNFIVRKEEYFHNMMKHLNPYCKLFLVKYSYEKDKNNIYHKINKCKSNIDNLNIKLIKLEESLKDIIDEKKLDKTNQKIKSLKKELSLNNSQIDSLENKLITISSYKNKEIYLSGAIYLYWGNKAWYLYGASHNVLRDTMPNFLMQYSMIKDSIDNDCEIYDFRGVSGDLDENNPLYGLYKFKKMFNGDFVEFIGEYTLVNNKGTFFMFKKLFPKFKEIRNSIFQRK